MDKRLSVEKWYSSINQQAPKTTVCFLKNKNKGHVAIQGQTQNMICWYPICYHQVDVQCYTFKLLFIKVR